MHGSSLIPHTGQAGSSVAMAAQEAWIREEAEKRWSKPLSHGQPPPRCRLTPADTFPGSYPCATCVLSHLGHMTRAVPDGLQDGSPQES